MYILIVQSVQSEIHHNFSHVDNNEAFKVLYILVT